MTVSHAWAKVGTLHAAPGVASRGDVAGDLERLVAGGRERHHRVRAEADAGGPAAGPDGLGPGLGRPPQAVRLTRRLRPWPPWPSP